MENGSWRMDGVMEGKVKGHELKSNGIRYMPGAVHVAGSTRAMARVKRKTTGGSPSLCFVQGCTSFGAFEIPERD